LLQMDHLVPHSDWRMPKQLSKSLTEMFKDVAFWPKDDDVVYWFTDVSETSRNIAFWTQVMQFEVRLASMPLHSPRSAWLELYTKWLTECVTTLDPTTASSQSKLLVVQEDALSFGTIPEVAADEIRGFEEGGDQGVLRTMIQVDRCCGYSPAVLQQGGDVSGEYHVISYGGNNVRMPYLLISVEPNNTYVRHMQQLQGAPDGSNSASDTGVVSMPSSTLPPSSKAAMMGAAIVLEWRLQALLEQRAPEQMANQAELWEFLLARQAEAFCVPIFIIDGPRVELWSMEYARTSLDSAAVSLPVAQSSVNPHTLSPGGIEMKKAGDSPETDPETSLEEGAVTGDTEVGEGDGGVDTEMELSGEYVLDNSRYAMHFVDGFDLSADRADSSRADLLRLALLATNLLNLAEHCRHFQPKVPQGYPTLSPSAAFGSMDKMDDEDLGEDKVEEEGKMI